MACSVTLSLLATGAIEMILLSRYRWTYPGSAWVVAGFSVLAPVSLTLTWTVRVWMTAPLAGLMMVSLAAPPGRTEVGGPGGPLAAWPLPPPPRRPPPRCRPSPAARARSREHPENHRGRDRRAEGPVVDGHELGLQSMAAGGGVDRGGGRVRHGGKHPIQVEMDVALVRRQVRGGLRDDACPGQAEPDPDGSRGPRSGG